MYDPSVQRAIATALSDTDALITSLDNLIAKKRDIKTGAMQQLLTGKQRLPGFSKKWETQNLKQVVEHISGGVYGAEKWIDGLIPFRVATTAHMNEDNTWNDKPMAARYYSHDQIKKYTPCTGDMIVVKSSGSADKIKSGKIGFVTAEISGTFIFSNFLMLLRPITVNAEFLFYFLTSYTIKSALPNLCEASTYPNLRINEYLDIDMPYPQLEEQTVIARVLSDIDAEIAALEARCEKTKTLKQGMMQQLLTGNIRLV